MLMASAETAGPNGHTAAAQGKPARLSHAADKMSRRPADNPGGSRRSLGCLPSKPGGA